MVKWHKLQDKMPDIEGVMFGKWYEDDCKGYYGPSRWLWFASGEIVGDQVWIDIDDNFREWQGIGYDKPTHYCIEPDWGKP